MTNPDNQVHLTGRVSSAVEERELPSGDRIASFRIVVPRAAKTRKHTKQTVDVFDCTAWTAKSRRTVSRLNVDDTVHVEGELRRSFRRSDGPPTSFIGIDIGVCSRLF